MSSNGAPAQTSNLSDLVKATSKLRPSKQLETFDHVKDYDPINISINLGGSTMGGTGTSGNQTKTTTPATPVPPQPPLPTMTIPAGTPDILTLSEKKNQPLSTQDVSQIQKLSDVPPPIFSKVTAQPSAPTINYAALAASIRAKAARTKLYIGLGVGFALAIIIVIVVLVLLKRKKNKNKKKTP